jgi:uncharacterized membrane protein
LLSEIFFVIAVVFTTATCIIEWSGYWESQLLEREIFNLLFLQGVLCAWSVCLVVLVLRPVSPGGPFCRMVAAIAGGIAGLTAVSEAGELYRQAFSFLLNSTFAIQLSPAAALFIAVILLRKEKQTDGISPKWYQGFALAGVVLLWGVLSQQVYLYWDCRNQFGGGIMDWRFKANLSLSLLWAGYGAVLLVVGFWKQIAVLRYLALGLFGLLLVKVFIVDMATVKSVYRISAFLATGLTLVGVSYLYQFLKKKGFFEAIRLQ